MNNPSTAASPAPTHDERNVRLLPRHWAWLEKQSRSPSASLRLLVEEASKDKDGRYRAARIREACYLYMRDHAGDRPHFEEAVRAFFANDMTELHLRISSWPLDIRRHIEHLLRTIEETP